MNTWANVLQIAKHIVQRRPVFFVGSGLSRNSGFPGPTELMWNIREELKLCDKCDDKSPQTRCSGLAEIVQCARAVKGKPYSKILCSAFGGAWPARHRDPWLTLDESIQCYFEGTLPFPVTVPHVVIARLAREGLISEVVTTNYDCLLEFACWSTGMEQVQPEAGSLDNNSILFSTTSCRKGFTVLNSKSYWNSLRLPSVLNIIKIHGGIEDAITQGNSNLSSPQSGRVRRLQWKDECELVLAWEDLVDWRKSSWARPLFYDRACSSLMILTGFSAADPYLFSSFMEALTMRDSNEACSMLNLVAIDPGLNIHLRTLAKQGNISNTDGAYHNTLDRLPCQASMSDALCPDSQMCPYGPVVQPEFDAGSVVRGLYTDLYVAVCINILESNLESHGLETYIDILGGGEGAIRNAHKAVDIMAGFLSEMKDSTCSYPHGFSRSGLFMNFLPAALVNSVVASLPPKDIGQVANWKNREGFYVPMLEHMRNVYVIMLYVAQCFNKAKKDDCHIVLCQDGTIEEIIPGKAYACHRLLPLVVEGVEGTDRVDYRERRESFGQAERIANLMNTRLFGFHKSIPRATPIVLTGVNKTRSGNSMNVLSLRDVVSGRIRLPN